MQSDADPPNPRCGTAREPESISEEAFDCALAALQLKATPEERTQILKMYDFYRPRIAAMYALSEARYEAPTLVFQAAPKLQAWGALPPTASEKLTEANQRRQLRASNPARAT